MIHLFENFTTINLVQEFINIYNTPISLITSGALTEENSLADVVIDFLEDKNMDIEIYLKPILIELDKLGYNEVWKEF